MKTVCLFCFLCLYTQLHAQQRDVMQTYEVFKQKSIQEYSDFRKEANAAYVEFVRQSWKEFKTKPALAVPVRPEPSVLPTYDPDLQPNARPLPQYEIVRLIPNDFQPAPEPLIPNMPSSSEDTSSFELFGATCAVHFDKSGMIEMPNGSEMSVAAAWEQLSASKQDAMLRDCLCLRQKLQLCDWGYFQLVQKLTATCLGSKDSNESIVLQTYLLTQSGYKIRLARNGGKLTILLPSQIEIYACPYIPMADCNYYMLDKTVAGESIQLCDFSFPGERFLSLYVDTPPLFPATTNVTSHILLSARYPSIQAEVHSDKNLIDFYNTFPSCHWTVYASAPLGNYVREQLTPTLKQAIAGKDESAAANILLNFVQTAFRYKTDEEQFGCERPLFADETIYYPFSDCEDRAILYSVLVRDLLGLDVVLVHYPNHLATAVLFEQPIAGDYITLDGAKYTICDPSYENADIGRAMPGTENCTAKIIRL